MALHLRNSRQTRCGRCDVDIAETDAGAMKPPPRTAWRGFADAVLLETEPATTRHRAYADAKAGDAEAAAHLVRDLVGDEGVESVRTPIERVGGSGAPVLVSASAYERWGVNAIPAALAELLSERLLVPFMTSVVQTNIVSHTGADGYGRLAHQARFGGDVDENGEHVMVDDFIGQGGTLANLRGWIETCEGKVVAAVVLTGKPYSARLSPTRERLRELRERHGSEFEIWWREHFGHTFDCLTQSEARYLARSPDVDTIRSRLAAAERAGDC